LYAGEPTQEVSGGQLGGDIHRWRGGDLAVTDYVLVPGAGGRGWYWHLVVAELTRRGNRAVAVDLPGPDPKAGLPKYWEFIVAVARAFDGPVTLVAQSLGGFSAPLACDHVAVEHLVLVNAMIPQAGETAGAWWDNVGWQAEAQTAADREGRPPVDVTDLDTLFFHDVPIELVDAMRADPDAAEEGPAVFVQPWSLAARPDVPTTVLAGRDHRLFPLSFERRLAGERLGLEVYELPGGHLLALSHPAALVDGIVSSGSVTRRT
jgi:pimeloyl-ACP methyl ester carboxylesterase